VQTTTDGLSNVITNGYDSLNNLTSEQLATGAKDIVGYTQAGQPHLATSVKDPQNNETTASYDTAGNLKTVHSTGLNADLQVNTYNTTKGTLATRTDGNKNLTKYGYDPAGNLQTVTPPAPAKPQTYTYDSLSRVATVTDGNNVQVVYSYDKIDRVVALSSGGKVLQVNTYDPLGNLSDRAVPGVDTTFKYAKTTAGSEAYFAGRTEGAGVDNVDYYYDKLGNLTEVSDAGGVVRYGYDDASRLTTLTDPWKQVTTYGYDNADHRTLVTFPGAGTQGIGYDKAGRETGITVKNTAGTALLSTAYNYTTAAGNDSDQMQSSTRDGATTAYSYDPDKRLKQAGATTFTSDNAGNLTALGGTGFTVNAADQFTVTGGDTLGFDGAGNLATGTTSGAGGATLTFGYSPTNQLSTATTGSSQVLSASYDTTDQTQRRTVTEKVGTATYNHTFGESSLGILQDVENGARASYARDPKGTFATMQNPAGSRYNLITDYQGSVIGMLDTTGNLAASYTYAPYGATTATGPAAGDNHFRWQGNYQLQGGVYLMGYRYYNPSYGRFTQPDPTQKENNPYTYAHGDPVNSNDPTGDSTAVNVFGIVLGAVGVGFGIAGLLTLAPEFTLLAGLGASTSYAGGVSSIAFGIGCQINPKC
jgi:RHS repeat-associated protein